MDMTPLAQWINQQLGPGKKFRTPRSLSIRAGLSQSTVSNILERGNADPETLRKLAEVLEVRPTKLFILAGWLQPEDLKEPALTDDETELLREFQGLRRESSRRGIVAATRAMRLAEENEGAHAA